MRTGGRRSSVVETATGRPVPLPNIPNGGVIVGPFSPQRNEGRVLRQRRPIARTTSTCSTSATKKRRSSPTRSARRSIRRISSTRRRVRFKARDGMTIPNVLWKPHQATAARKAPALVWVHGGPGGQTSPGYSAQSSTWSTTATSCSASTIAAAPATARRSSRPTTRSTARAAVGLRRREEVSAVARLRGSRPHRHHRRQLRRLHGARGAGVPARRVQRRRRHLRRRQLGAHAREHPGVVGSAAQGALRRDGRSRRPIARCWTRSRRCSTPTRSASR